MKILISILFVILGLRGGDVMAWEMTSPAFDNGKEIPRKYTCDGLDLSPPLEWTDPPLGTESLALIMDDPDAPVGTWVHWVIYDIPSDKWELSDAIFPKDTLFDGSKQGVNDFRKTGYGGPCPPMGSAHRYYFKLYALDKMLEMPPGKTRRELMNAMGGHILGETKLMGRYGR